MASDKVMNYVLTWGTILVLLFIPCCTIPAVVAALYLVLYKFVYKHQKPYFKVL